MKLNNILTCISEQIAHYWPSTKASEDLRDKDNREVRRQLSATLSQLRIAEQRKVFLGQTAIQVNREITLWQTRALDAHNSEHQSLACVGILQRFEARKKRLELQHKELERLCNLLSDRMGRIEAELLNAHGAINSNHSTGQYQQNAPITAASAFSDFGKASFLDTRFRVTDYSEELPVLKTRLQDLRRQKALSECAVS